MVIRFIMSFLAALALNIRFDIPQDMNHLASESKMLNIFYNFQGSLTGTMAAATMVFVLLCIIDRYLYKNKGKVHRTPVLFLICFCIAVVWVMGESFYRVNSLALLHMGAGQMVKTLVYVTGITWFLSEMTALLDLFLQSGWDWLPKKKVFFCDAYNKHPFKVSVVVLFVCWLPNLLLSYPATMCIDVWNQMLQSFGFQRFTTHHPPAHTVLAGAFERVGLLLGSANLGLFLYILFQTILFALILGYMFYTMKELASPTWLKVTAFIIAVSSPYYTQYIGMIVKDTIYSYFILLFVIELVYILLLKQEYWKSKKHCFLLAASMIGSVLFRNNGKYVIYPMILCILITVFLQNRNQRTDQEENQDTSRIRKKSRWTRYTKTFMTAVIMCLISVAVSSGFQNFLTRHYNIEPGGIQEALSLPFQQTARYVKEHEEHLIGYSFPGPEVLAKADLSEFKFGYREKYIWQTAEDVLTGKFELSVLQTAVAKGASPEEGKEMLKKLHGVGEKVASCIQLFGLHQLSLFPIDTWIAKVEEIYYNGHFPVERYEGIAGVMQQYLFSEFVRKRKNVPAWK